MRDQTTKLTEENIGKNVHDLELDKSKKHKMSNWALLK